MTTKQKIDTDLKAAMLARDKRLTGILRGLKSAVLYAELAAGKRDSGLDDQVVQQLLQKEAKKRQEAAMLYEKANETTRQQAELEEKQVIEKYLPEQLDDTAIQNLVEASIKSLAADSLAQMGRVIADVKKRSGGAADGATIARLVKEALKA
jgi:uncharacterized protein YqeY